MDLSLPLNQNVLVEREGFAFFSDIEYEKLPAFCNHCRKAGHLVQDCKVLRPQNRNSVAIPKPKPDFVPKSAPIPPEVVTSPVVEEGADQSSQAGVQDSEHTLWDESARNIIDPGVIGNEMVVTPNPQNFASQPSVEPGSPLSAYVDNTQDLVDRNEGFLLNSWGNLAEVQEVTVGAFTCAVDNLKHKRSARLKKKLSIRSQAGPLKRSL
ncbi:uncharacterized protein LOC131651127 [Vicia villosa]|uniref:uncharacterized protein LOC131651127 n=1 Tax=Vicia villosa TaxID=3911 RepID=UPI00273BC2F6|nr:uncharacterized protein LOC131651127 [Vicia villosa]